MKYYSVRWKDGKTEIFHDTWGNVKNKVMGMPGATFKGHITEQEAEAWLNRPVIPHREICTPYKNDTIYFFVDGSYSSKRKISGWGFVAVINNIKIAEGNGIIKDPPESRNICGELESAMQAVKWYNLYGKYEERTKGNKPVIVHDYSGIGNWALGYWGAGSAVAIKYQKFMEEHVHLFDFEKVDGHSGIEWNDYADELTRKGYDTDAEDAKKFVQSKHPNARAEKISTGTGKTYYVIKNKASYSMVGVGKTEKDAWEAAKGAVTSDEPTIPAN